MKLYMFFFSCLMIIFGANAQQNIRDKHITNQQERMVFKSWDANKFTPKPGFLGLNPLYWMTWGLHPNYPDSDLRPLGPHGPQTARLAFAVAMSTAEQAHKLQADSIRQTALFNLANHSGAIAEFDPLWNLYYSSQLSGLKVSPDNILQGLKYKQVSYLQQSGFIDWYQQEHQQLRERLEIARHSDMERGSRILYYHRLLLEYRKLQASWEDKKRLSKSLLEAKTNMERLWDSSIKGTKMTDIQIADHVLKNSKL